MLIGHWVNGPWGNTLVPGGEHLTAPRDPGPGRRCSDCMGLWVNFLVEAVSVIYVWG